MTTSEETVSEPRSISKAAFECLVLVMLIVLIISETVVALALRRALGFRLEGGGIGGLTVLNLVLARLAVDGILKQFGLSRSGKTLEVRGKTGAFPEGEVADDEVVEVRCPKSFAKFLFWTCVLGCVSFAVMAMLTPRLEPGILGLASILSGFFALGALNIWCDRKPQAWADRDGITGYPIGFHLRHLHRACAGHTHERTHPDATIRTCWDADRLDLGRVGIAPHPSRLCTEAAKRPEMIKWADGRARLRVVPDFVWEEWGIDLESNR